jgi:hypothetical protein
MCGAEKSCQVTSRPSFQGMSIPRFGSTITRSTDGASATASSAVCFIGPCLPRRQVPSAVKSAFAGQSFRRAATADGAKPLKIGM